MLQSFSQPYLKSINWYNLQAQQLQLQCQRCSQKPDQQFILLLCDHVLCANCLDLLHQTDHLIQDGQFRGIKCPCGLVTYFKADEVEQPIYTADFISNYQQQKKKDNTESKQSKNNITVNIHHNLNNRKTREGSTRASVGLIQSKNTIITKNISRLNTESIGSGLQNLNLSISSNRNQEKQKLMLQKSKYPISSKQYSHKLTQSVGIQSEKAQHSIKKNEISQNMHRANVPKKFNKDHFEPKYIQSQSIVQQKENIQPNYKPHFKSKMQPQYGLNYSVGKLSRKQQQLSRSLSRNKTNKNLLGQQLKSQLEYLRVTHKKGLESLYRVFNQTVNKINSDFQCLEGQFKDLYLQTMLSNRNETKVNLAKIIKMRYESYIGNTLQKMTEFIQSFYNQNQFKINWMAADQYVPQLKAQPVSIYEKKQRNYAQDKNRVLTSGIQTMNISLDEYEQKKIDHNYKKCLQDHYIPRYYDQMGGRRTYNYPCSTVGSQHTCTTRLQKKPAKRRTTNIVIQI